MIHIIFWLQVLLVALVQRQLATASEQCSELREEMSSLERDIMRITELKHYYEIQAGNYQEQLTQQFHIRQSTATKLKKTEGVISGLKKQLEAKEEALKSSNQKQEQLQTAIDGLTQTVKSLNQTVQRLCAQPKDVCRYLLEAAKSGDVNTAKVLFKCSNDSCTDNEKHRTTPLMYAATYDHVAMVRVLLEEGANVERGNDFARTALHHAALSGHPHICRLLLDWGAKVAALDNGNETPLHFAAWLGHLSVVKLLVKRGADVNLKDGEGETALHEAAWRGHLSVVKELVQRGGNVSLKNNSGQTASGLARSEGKKDVAEWLDSVSRG